MHRLTRYLARYWVRLVGGVSALVAATSLAMVVPWCLKEAVDALGPGGDRSAVPGIVALTIGVALVQMVVRTFSRFVVFNVGRDVEFDLRNDLFAHLERLPLAFYQQRQTGDLMSRLVNDVGAVRMLLGPGILNLINTPVYYAYGLTIMLSIDVRLTVYALAAYPLGLVFVKRMSRLLMERTIKVQEGLAALSSRVQENLAGIHVVKAYAAEPQETAAFLALNQQFRRDNLRLARTRGFIGPIMNIVGGVGALVVLWIGGQRVIADALTVGDLVAFIAYLHVLAWPTMAMGWMLSIVQRGRAAMRRLEDVFAVAPAIVGPDGASAPGGCRGEIQLQDVVFRFPGTTGPPAVDGIDLTIPAGKTIAIVGRTGSGKSALVQLLARLFDVERGAVRLDGRDVRALPLGWLRRAVGVVPQDPFLFSRSIRENVAFAQRPNGHDRVDWAIQMAGLDRDVAEFPKGLDTIVGERGITLSGGQRQRTTLARVVAAEPRVLVLDDALSAVDAATERAILDRLRGFFRERTTILVSHRVTTVREADVIVVIDAGRVVELGDHEGLIARRGLYAELFERQALETELEAS